MAHGVTPEALGEALRRSPEIRTAFIVSPTYYGMAADIGGCAEVAHAAGVALVVDCAWGAHFGFHPALPESPLSQGADAVLTSTHKIVGSLTQSAMLHVAEVGMVDPDEVARCVRLMRSTSPSSLLLGSLDAARRQLAAHGEALLDRTLRRLGSRQARDRGGTRVLGRRRGHRRSARGRRLGSAADRDRRPRDRLHRLRDRRRATCPLRHPTSSWHRTRRSCWCSASLSRSSRSSTSCTTSPRPCDGYRDRETHPRIARSPVTLEHETVVPVREAFLGRRRGRGGRRCGRPDLVRVDRRLSARRAGAAAGRAGDRGAGRLPSRPDGRRGATARCRRPQLCDDQGSRPGVMIGAPGAGSRGPGA